MTNFQANNNANIETDSNNKRGCYKWVFIVIIIGVSLSYVFSYISAYRNGLRLVVIERRLAGLQCPPGILDQQELLSGSDEKYISQELETDDYCYIPVESATTYFLPYNIPKIFVIFDEDDSEILIEDSVPPFRDRRKVVTTYGDNHSVIDINNDRKFSLEMLTTDNIYYTGYIYVEFYRGASQRTAIDFSVVP